MRKTVDLGNCIAAAGESTSRDCLDILVSEEYGETYYVPPRQIVIIGRLNLIALRDMLNEMIKAGDPIPAPK